MRCSTAFTRGIRILAAASLFAAPAFAAGGMGASAPDTAGGPDLEASDPLYVANKAFRDAYARLRSETLAKTDPIIFSAGDDLILIKGGKRTQAQAVTRRYHELKAVAHVPLTLYTMLVSGADAPIEPARLMSLGDYRSLIATARLSLDGRRLSPQQSERQKRLLDASLRLLDSTLAAGRVSAADLKAFTRSQLPDIQANVREAAQDQIDAMEARVAEWLSDMTPAERSRLRVVVAGSHMPRVGNIAYQYFQAKFGAVYEGRWAVEEDGSGRLVFGEGAWDEQKALNLLATHSVDAGIADYFFADAQRMHRDLLADAAEEVITAKFGKKPAARRF